MSRQRRVRLRVETPDSHCWSGKKVVGSNTRPYTYFVTRSMKNIAVGAMLGQEGAVAVAEPSCSSENCSRLAYRREKAAL